MVNIHPILVHFPIALLTFYCVLEIVPLMKWYPKVAWSDVKALLVCFGGLGILGALLTGGLAEDSNLARASEHVLAIHKFFAATSAAVFGIIALAYLIWWIFEKHIDPAKPLGRGVKIIKGFSDIILKRWVVILLAILGLGVLTLTGTLGGIIVYGADSDFATKFVYSLFFRN
jgi:uncharacterized membrane protein